MENMSKKAKRQVTKDKRQKAKVFTFHLLLFTWTVLLTFGCEEPLQSTINPSGSFDDNLLYEADRIIREGLADNNPQVRANAIEVVTDTRQLRLMPVVRRLLRDEAAPVRFNAALAVADLRHFPAKSDVKQLMEERKENENIRIAAAYALYKLGSSESLSLIGEAITNKDQIVRANAALLLGKIGDKSALKLLYWVLRDKDSDDRVRFNAAEAIAMLGDEQIYQKLWAMLISAYADDRVMGVRAMGALRTRQAKNALITMLDDNVLDVRLAAAEQLGKLKDPVGEAEVLKVLTKNLTASMDREDRERVKVLTALAIGEIGTDALTKFLPQLLRDESKNVRLAAAKAVFRCATR